MANNKIQLSDGTVLLDLTNDTVAADKLLEGETAHDAAGEPIVGTMTAGDKIQHADIPDYVKSAALEVAKKVRAVQKDESITFIAMSDAHQLDTNNNIVVGNLHAGMAAKILAYSLPNLDFCCYLGDYTAGSSTTTIAEGKQHFAEINADIDEAFSGIPQFRTLGNHDSLRYSEAQNGSVLSEQELYNFVGRYNSGITWGGSAPYSYGYRDFESKKLRVICLNTADETQKENLSAAQKQWFAENLKSVGAKSGWSIIILSHHPLDWGGINIASNIVKAYIDGGSITVESGVTVNFSGSNKAKILGCFHGHTHCFKAAKLNLISGGVGTPYNIWRIATPNMCFLRNNEYGQNGNTEYYGIEFGEEQTYNKSAGSANDTAFVVNVINPSEEKIYSFCYGAGYDREIFTGKTIIHPASISLNKSALTITEGGTAILIATVLPENADDKTVKWSTSNGAIATVSGGVITAVAEGSVIITATASDGGLTATCAITVEAEVQEPTNILDLVGYTDGKRLSTSSGTLKDATGYFTTGEIDISRATYSNGCIFKVSGVDSAKGGTGTSPYSDSSIVLYTAGSSFNSSTYISDTTMAAGNLTVTVDADNHGCTIETSAALNTALKTMRLAFKSATGATCTIIATKK